MNDVIRQMNASPTGINVFYDEHSDKLSVIRTETGKFNPNSPSNQADRNYDDINDAHREIKFSNGFFQDAFKLGLDEERGGENAKFTINGLETERRSNTFTMNGVTMTLKGTFAEGTNNVTIGASTNVDSIMDLIKGFVD
ncbi:flagellar filament capping protein FliD, partial [Pseudomonas sp. 2822-17]|uniref:flagellar filament capping protein FliD n=1 Tax=Pseudomonas sp. 2822-17 TaxID=1712678 RepID=UPI001303FB93